MNSKRLSVLGLLCAASLIMLQFILFITHSKHDTHTSHGQSKLSQLLRTDKLRKASGLKPYAEKYPELVEEHNPRLFNNISSIKDEVIKPIEAIASSSNSTSKIALDNHTGRDRLREEQPINISIVPPFTLFSMTKDSKVSNLPSFVHDGSDFILGSLIELSFDHFGPFVTTFFLSHSTINPPRDSVFGIKTVSPETKPYWREAALKFQDLEYDMNGRRFQSIKYFCRIRHSPYDQPYIVTGEFLPNKLTPDSNSNRRLDIFRCPLANARNATRAYRDSEHSIQVEIIRESIILINFRIPWQSRRTGYLLDSVAHMSHWNAWPDKSSVADAPIIHLCMPGKRQIIFSNTHC
jgi:hypothetical protein